MGMMFRQCLRTKEQPDGHIYDEARFQTVLRIIDGKVLISNQPDSYCWKIEKVLSSKKVCPIGVNCADALLALMNVLNEITDNEEKKLLAEMFSKMKEDMLLVTTPTEQRHCIEVTDDLYAQGITYCVDEWMDVNANGEAPITELQIGDYLIVSDNNSVYRIGRDEFLRTHKLI
jgi:hypothetical protein